MTKLYILQEIQRTTKANGGTPLRKLQFESITGIRRYNWFGVYWARWSDAIREAGYLGDHLEELTSPPHSKPLRYERARPAPIGRLA